MRRFVVLALLVTVGIWDLSRPPSAQWSAAAALAGIHAYRRTLSPLIGGAGVRCRFTVSCSHYAEAVIRRDGLVAGSWKTARRLVRCGPWTPAGTVDNP